MVSQAFKCLQITLEFLSIDNREVSFQTSEEDLGGAASYFIGGGMVETFAYGGAPPEDASISGMADLAAPSPPLSLTNAVAMSSNFYAGNFGGFFNEGGVLGNWRF